MNEPLRSGRLNYGLRVIKPVQKIIKIAVSPPFTYNLPDVNYFCQI